MKPKAMILRTAGTNCDAETAYAFELAGAEAEYVHINRLLQGPSLLDAYQLLAIPGGFSYGDDIAAGRILANQIAHHLSDALHAFVDSGRPIIGICNGFQVLIKTDLLPGPIPAGHSADEGNDATPARCGQTCTLAHNDAARFIDRWIHLAARPSRCIWTKGLQADAGLIELPIAHGEGKFVCGDDRIRHALWDHRQVVLTYAHPDGSPANGQAPANPNGSIDDIAGVCDATGLIFGLMPHPERHVDATQHPAWSRRRPLPAEGQGLSIFRSAVSHVNQSLGAGV